MKTNLTIMSLMCVYMFKLALGHDFVYYIHPRYITFSIVATLLCSVVVLKTWRHSHEIHTHKEERSRILSFLIICTLLVAIVLPAKGLTATTAMKRFNSGSQNITMREVIETQPEIATNNNEEVDSTSMQDTGSATNTSPFIVMPRSDDPGDIFSNFVFNLETTDNLNSFKDAEVELVGFVLIDSADGTSKYHVARFFIACCTADANPIGVPFEYYGSEYKNGDWIKVKGKLKIVRQDNFEKIMIVPSSINRVEEPEFPYAYY